MVIIFSANKRERHIKLQSHRDKLLRWEEETWNLKSREMWLEAGHNNTRFLHRYENQRRITNSI